MSPRTPRIPALRSLLILLAIAVAAQTQGRLPPRAVELQARLKTAKDGERLPILNELAAWLSENDTAEAMRISREALQIATAQGDVAAEATALHNIAVTHRTLGEYEVALATLLRVQRLRQSLKDSKGVAEALNTRGLIQYEMGHFESALETHLTALALRQKIDDVKGQGYSYNNLASVYRATGDVDRAIAYLKASIEIKTRVGAEQGLGYSLSNLGQCYLLKNRDAEAIQSLEEALQIRLRLKDPRAIADSMNSLGRAYAKTGDLKKAERYFRQALEQAENINEQRAIALNRNGLAGVLVQQNRPQEAQPYLKSALAIALKNRNHPVEVESLRLLAESYALQGDSESSLEFFRRYHRRQSDLFTLDSARRMADLKSRFDSQRQEEELSRLRLESERSRAEIDQQSTKRNFLLAVLLLMTVSIALVVNRYVMRRRSEAEYRRKNEELEEKSKQLEVLNIELHRISSVKSRFLANMSHEIRTPMNGVMGMTDLLLRGELSGEQRHFAQLARASAENLLTVVNDILDYAKIEADRLELYEKDFAPLQVLEDLCELMAVRAHSRGLGVQLICEPAIPSIIHGDPDRLRQVIFNLLGNAVKFSDSGDIVVRATLAGEGTISFSVSDQGVGIAPERIERLFQPFSQVDDSITRKQGGTGLGLAISRRLVELMGGAMEVESQPGKGSIFHFTLPLNLAQVKNAPAAPSLPTLQSVTALVLGKDTECEAADSILKSAGARAMRDVDAAGAPCHAVILPLNRLSEMPAAEVAALRQRQSDPQAPIIAVYPLGSRPGVLPTETFGLVLTVSQPLRRSSLLAAMAQVTARSGQPETASVPSPLPAIVRRTGEPASVLLVEDNRVNQTLAVAYLKRLQCHVELASNGAEALQKLAEARYDAVLMDVEMPVMDGLSATQAIRAGKVNRTDARIPIIAMTAHAMDDDRRRFLSAGMSDYVSKPVEVATLAKVLRRWIPAPENVA